MSADPERILSVFELTHSLRRAIEDLTAGFWIAGEVGGLKCPPSGHVYFSLKDEERDAMLDCVMYRREAIRFGKHVSEGARVQIRGRASLYAARGRLQWICDVVRPAGQGALLVSLARLRQKLIDEGLTDPERKRPLPRDPKLVGVVTSASGAAFHDIRIVAERRGRVRLLLSPALVQGEQAADSIIGAIDLIERVRDLDVLIVGRGGGSQEDLLAFSDERVVRRIAACRVPVVSAVGHEVDVALADLVADVRAATPTEAAELVVPEHAERVVALGRVLRQLGQAMRVRVARHQSELDQRRRLLSDPRFVLAEHEQALDELRLRMERALQRRLALLRRTHGDWSRQLEARHPRLVLERARGRLAPLRFRLGAAARHGLERRAVALRAAARALQTLSPLSILGRGYALATDEHGAALLRASSLEPGASVHVRLHQGAFSATVRGVEPEVETGAGFLHESSHDERGEDLP